MRRKLFEEQPPLFQKLCFAIIVACCVYSVHSGHHHLLPLSTNTNTDTKISRNVQNVHSIIYRLPLCLLPNSNSRHQQVPCDLATYALATTWNGFWCLMQSFLSDSWGFEKNALFEAKWWCLRWLWDVVRVAPLQCHWLHECRRWGCHQAPAVLLGNQLAYPR